MTAKWLVLALGLAGGWLARPVAALPAPWPPPSYAFYYGEWTEATLNEAWRFRLVVLHPGQDFTNISPALCRQLQQGRDGLRGTADDVTVLGYVSVGEDEAVPAGPPPAGSALNGPLHYAQGRFSPQGTSYPTCYLDQVAWKMEAGFPRLGPDGKPITVTGADGVPDENGVWGSYYVNPGDEGWRRSVQTTMERLDRELGVDGFFLDTLDTASPWGNYGFTQAGMAGLLQGIRRAWPQKILIGNRGMFLLDTHAEAYRSSLDGVLFESFLTEWNWALSAGFGSPWLAGNRDLLVGSMKGLPTLFIDYLNLHQSDFYNYLHQALDLGALGYFADPLLQKFSPPTSELFPAQSNTPMASLGSLQVSGPGGGRLRLKYAVANPGGLQWGESLFLDVRYGPPAASEPAVLPALPVDYAGAPGTFESYGLPDGAVTVYVRLLGRAQNLRTAWQSATLPATGAGPAVEGLQAAGRQDAVELSWQGPACEVYQGSDPFRLKKVASVQGSRHLVTGLPVGQPRWFAVARQAGAPGRPVCASAVDCTPPPAPAGVTATTAGANLVVSWQPVTAPDLGGYRVYTVPEGQRLRIPVRQGADVTRVQLGPAASGRYRIFVTAVDTSGNEARPAEFREVDVP